MPVTVPVRSCIGCRRKAAQDELTRDRAADGWIPGRRPYTARSGCLALCRVAPVLRARRPAPCLCEGVAGDGRRARSRACPNGVPAVAVRLRETRNRCPFGLRRQFRQREGTSLPKNPRVHELAKELGLTNKELLDLCEQLGIGVKSHSSSIQEAQADRVRRKADQRGIRRDEQPEEPKKAPAKKAAAKKAAAKQAAPDQPAEPAAPSEPAPRVEPAEPAAETPAPVEEPAAAPAPAPPPAPPVPEPELAPVVELPVREPEQAPPPAVTAPAAATDGEIAPRPGRRPPPHVGRSAPAGRNSARPPRPRSERPRPAGAVLRPPARVRSARPAPRLRRKRPAPTRLPRARPRLRCRRADADPAASRRRAAVVDGQAHPAAPRPGWARAGPAAAVPVVARGRPDPPCARPVASARRAAALPGGGFAGRGGGRRIQRPPRRRPRWSSWRRSRWWSRRPRWSRRSAESAHAPSPQGWRRRRNREELQPIETPTYTHSVGAGARRRRRGRALVDAAGARSQAEPHRGRRRALPHAAGRDGHGHAVAHATT